MLGCLTFQTIRKKIEIKRVCSQLRIINDNLFDREWKEYEYLVRTCGKNIFQVLS